MKLQKLQKIIFIIFVCLILSSAILYTIFADEISIDTLRQNIKNFGILSPIIFIAIYTLGTIFIPSTPFMATAGILFGFKYGLLYTVIGGFLSSLIVFTVARFFGKVWVENILQHKYLKVVGSYNDRLESGGLFDLIILRMTPIMPFNVLNILMGVSRISVQNYIAGTVIGLAPSNVLSVYFGTFITKLF